MRRSSWVVVGLIVVLAAALLYARMAGRTDLTDEDQIQALLAKGQSAIENKDLKGALSCISRDYSDRAGLKFDTLRLQAAQAFQERGRYDVTLENASMAVDGDKAEVEVGVTLDLTTQGKRNRVYAGRMGLSLRKEEGKHWLVIPVQKWKVTEIGGLTAITGENMGF